MVVVAGIDVSKATLEVSVSEGPVLRFDNSATGIRRLVRHLERAGATKAVCESTGGYERLVVGKLRETTINVLVAHPVRVRAFARACGYEARPTLSMLRCCLATARCSLSRMRRNRMWILTVRSCGSC